MRTCKKGTAGYLDEKKKTEIFRTVVYFLIVAAIYLLGYTQTHTNKNLLTVVAVVGALPACKALTGVITRLPYKSVSPEFEAELRNRCPHLTVIADLVITSREKIMPLDAVVISGDKIFGYTSSEKVDVNYAAKHIKDILVQNRFSKVSVKIQNDYKAFLARAEGLENIAAVEQNETSAHEQRIARTILSISL